jgi:hypothetical protein
MEDDEKYDLKRTVLSRSAKDIELHGEWINDAWLLPAPLHLLHRAWQRGEPVEIVIDGYRQKYRVVGEQVNADFGNGKVNFMLQPVKDV